MSHKYFLNNSKFPENNISLKSTSESLKDRKTLSRDEFIDIAKKDEKAKLISFISLQDLKGSIHFGGGYSKLKCIV